MAEDGPTDTIAGRALFIPSETIAGFFMSPGTEAVLRVAFDDRLLARTTHEIRPGGIRAAIEHYASANTPDILIVEADETGPALFAAIDELAEVSTVTTRLVLVGETNDVALFRTLTARGVSDYLVKPIKPGDVLDSLSRLSLDPAERIPARTIAFIGAGGGSGSSTLAQNVAALLAQRPTTDVLLVDIDLAFGSAALNIDLSPAQTTADALTEGARLDAKNLQRMLLQRGDRLQLLAAPGTVDELPDFGADQLLPLLDRARFLSDVVILDVPGAMTPLTRAALALADHVVIVALPSLVSLRNTQLLYGYCSRLRPTDLPPTILLNKVGIAGEKQLTAAEFEKVLRIKPLLDVPFAPGLFSSTISEARLAAETARSGSTALSRLRRLAEHLVPADLGGRKRRPRQGIAAPLAGLFGWLRPAR